MRNEKISENLLEKAKKIEEIRSKEVIERREMTFIPKEMTQFCFPYKKTSERQIETTVGNLHFCLTATNPKYDIPYGTYPRLLMFFLTREALNNKKTKNGDEQLDINLGGSLSEFLGKLNLGNDGRTMSGVKKQLANLLSTSIVIEVQTEVENFNYTSTDFTFIADNFSLWQVKHKGERGKVSTLEGMELTLTRKAFELLTRSDVPLDMGMLTVLKQSPYQMDVYAFVTRRVHKLNRPVLIPWSEWMKQFGSKWKSNKQSIKDFRKKTEKVFKVIKLGWPSLEYEITPKGVILFPQLPHVFDRETRKIAEDMNKSSSEINTDSV